MPRGPLIRVAPAAVPTRRFSDLTPEQWATFATPSGFARRYLGLELYPKQAAILDAFATHGARVTACTCNEYGKTTRIIAPLLLWHMTAFPRLGDPGGAISTSGSWSQIEFQLVPALKRFRHRFPGYEFLNDSIQAPNGIPQWMGFSVTNVGRAEGFHGHDQQPLLALVDEAKTVQDGVFQAVEGRCNPQRFGMLSSPGYAEGEFYRSHTRDRHLYQCFKAKARPDAPHISQESIDRRVAKWGQDHPLVKSMIHAEFMELTENALLTLTQYDECVDQPPPFDNQPYLHAFCDFAAGGDENVLAVAHGNRAWIERAWREKNTMAAAGQFVADLHKLNRDIGLMPEHVEGDDCGMGVAVIDRIHELGWPIQRFHGQAPAVTDPLRFANRNAEVWWGGVDRIVRKAVMLPRDEDLRAQVCNRKSVPGPRGTLAVEHKDDLLKRNQPSPDRADAVLGAMAPLPSLRGRQVLGRRENSIGDRLAAAMQAQGRVPESILAGADTGG